MTWSDSDTMPRSTLAPDRRSAGIRIWVVALIYGLLTCAAVLPVFSVNVPLLVDYPNHLARLQILATIDDVPALQERYAVEWAVLPNLAMDALLPPLVGVLSVFEVGRLFIALTLLLIFVVLVYVYPLKAIYSGAFDFFSGGYLESYFELGSIDDLRTMLLLFGLFYMALSGVVVLLNRHALANADKLSLNELERFDTITEIRHWIINAAVPLISIVLALFLPDNLVPVAGMFYSVFAIVIPWHISRRMRVRRNLS